MFSKKTRLEQVRDTVQDRASDTWSDLAPQLENARDQITPLIEDALKKAGPVLDDARDRIVNDFVPAVSSALADAREKASPYIEDAKAEGARRGAATAAALRGEVDAPKKGGKLKKVLLAGGLLGLGAFVFSKVRGGSEPDAWQSSYTPPAPPSPKPVSDTAANKPPAPAKKTAAPKDGAGASPDEAASDDAAEKGPHAVTTPDDPADQVDVSGEPDPKG